MTMTAAWMATEGGCFSSAQDARTVRSAQPSRPEALAFPRAFALGAQRLLRQQGPRGAARSWRRRRRWRRRRAPQPARGADVPAVLVPAAARRRCRELAEGGLHLLVVALGLHPGVVAAALPRGDDPLGAPIEAVTTAPPAQLEEEKST